MCAVLKKYIQGGFYYLLFLLTYPNSFPDRYEWGIYYHVMPKDHMVWRGLQYSMLRDFYRKVRSR